MAVRLATINDSTEILKVYKQYIDTYWTTKASRGRNSIWMCDIAKWEKWEITN